MNLKLSIYLSLTTIALTGCRQMGQGTSGDTFQTGTGTAAGTRTGTSMAGRGDTFRPAGFPDATIAASREEAALDVSGSGTEELARRSASATVDDPVSSLPAPAGYARASRPATSTTRSNQIVTSDDILLDRVRQALSSTTPATAGVTPALSIQTLNNLQLTVRNGIVTMRGRVGTYEEKKNIEGLIRDVPGIQAVNDQLEAADQMPAPAGR
jgi:osmotically-inducible protein OsmY